MVQRPFHEKEVKKLVRRQSKGEAKVVTISLLLLDAGHHRLGCLDELLQQREAVHRRLEPVAAAPQAKGVSILRCGATGEGRESFAATPHTQRDDNVGRKA